jgi:hypothetical protein
VYLGIKTITKKTEMVVVVIGKATTLEDGTMAGTTITLEATTGQQTPQCLVGVGAVGERDLRECSRPPIVAGKRGLVG